MWDLFVLGIVTYFKTIGAELWKVVRILFRIAFGVVGGGVLFVGTGLGVAYLGLPQGFIVLAIVFGCLGFVSGFAAFDAMFDPSILRGIKASKSVRRN